MKHNELRAQSHRITYLSGRINYTWIHFTNAPQFLHCRTLGYCLDLLPAFIRIHRSFAVNPALVNEVRGHNTTEMEVRIGEKWLPVSRRQKFDVIEMLQIFHQPGLLPGLPSSLYF